MAQKIQTLFIDDIDGSEAQGTVPFGLDGQAYEIDLNAAHAAELRSALETYVSHARRITQKTNAVKGGSRAAREATRGFDTEEARTWLKANGYGDQLKERGRIRADLVQKFMSRTPAENTTAPAEAPKAPVEAPKAETPPAATETAEAPAETAKAPKGRGGRNKAAVPPLTLVEPKVAATA